MGPRGTVRCEPPAARKSRVLEKSIDFQRSKHSCKDLFVVVWGFGYLLPPPQALHSKLDGGSAN
eukprot:6828441-Pyramimonas_sp.AAC.1